MKTAWRAHAAESNAHTRAIEVVRYRGHISTFIHVGVLLSTVSIWIFNRHNLHGDNQRFSRQRMIEIEQSLLRQDPYDSRKPPCAILDSVTFPSVQGQIIWRNGCNFGFIVWAKRVFHRQRKRYGFSGTHARHALFNPSRDQMFALDEFLGIDIREGGYPTV
jgi:hypothetical protein